MAIAVECPGCRAGLQVPDRLAGKKIRCKTCHEEFRVGGDEPSEEYDDEPRPRRRSKQPSVILSLLVVGGILAFCLIVAVGVILWIAARDQNPQPRRTIVPVPVRPTPTGVPAQYTLFPPQPQGRAGRAANIIDGAPIVEFSNLRRVESQIPNQPTYQVDYKWIGNPPQRSDHYSLFAKTPNGVCETMIHFDAGRMVGDFTFSFFPGHDPGQGFDIWIGQVKAVRGGFENRRLSNAVSLK
jgi:hypothetical protein